MLINPLLSLLALLAIAIGCKPPGESTKKSSAPEAAATAQQSSDATPTVPAGFLSSADFRYSGAIMHLTASDLAAKLNARPEFFSKPPPNSTDHESCLSTSVLSTHFVRATKESITATVDADLSSCDQANWQKGAPSATISIAQDHLQALISYVCPGADLTSYDGKTIEAALDSLNDAQPCFKAGKTFKRLINFRLTVKATIVTRDATNDMNTDYVAAVVGPDFGACETTVTGDMQHLQGCQLIGLNRDDSKGNSGSEATTFTANQLAAKAGDSYYSTGTYDLVLDDWTGQMSYSGSNTPPTWTLLAKSGESVSGKFAYADPSTALPTSGSSGLADGTLADPVGRQIWWRLLPP